MNEAIRLVGIYLVLVVGIYHNGCWFLLWLLVFTGESHQVYLGTSHYRKKPPSSGSEL